MWHSGINTTVYVTSVLLTRLQLYKVTKLIQHLQCLWDNKQIIHISFLCFLDCQRGDAMAVPCIAKKLLTPIIVTQSSQYVISILHKFLHIWIGEEQSFSTRDAWFKYRILTISSGLSRFQKSCKTKMLIRAVQKTLQMWRMDALKSWGKITLPFREYFIASDMSGALVRCNQRAAQTDMYFYLIMLNLSIYRFLI